MITASRRMLQTVRQSCLAIFSGDWRGLKTLSPSPRTRGEGRGEGLERVRNTALTLTLSRSTGRGKRKHGNWKSPIILAARGRSSRHTPCAVRPVRMPDGTGDCACYLSACAVSRAKRLSTWETNSGMARSGVAASRSWMCQYCTRSAQCGKNSCMISRCSASFTATM